jgi:hypothetical protein
MSFHPDSIFDNDDITIDELKARRVTASRCNPKSSIWCIMCGPFIIADAMTQAEAEWFASLHNATLPKDNGGFTVQHLTKFGK